MPREAAGGRRKQPQASWQEASPAREAWASANVSSPWPPAKPDRNYTQHVPGIARTMSVWRSSPAPAGAGSRSATGGPTTPPRVRARDDEIARTGAAHDRQHAARNTLI